MNPFEVLGLPDTVTILEVKTRWRELAKEHHPDQGGSSEKLQELLAAYREAVAAVRARPCPACKGTGLRTVQRGFNLIKLPCETCG